MVYILSFVSLAEVASYNVDLMTCFIFARVLTNVGLMKCIRMYVRCHSFQTYSWRDEFQLLFCNLDIVQSEGAGQLKKEDNSHTGTRKNAVILSL
jgi:hypothetical protein